MFHLSKVQNKVLALLSLTLVLPYMFKTTNVFDPYWEEWYLEPSGLLTQLAYGFAVVALVIRVKFVQQSILALATIWFLADFFPEDLSYWQNGVTYEFILTVLYIAGVVGFFKITLDEEALIHHELKRIYDYFQSQNSQLLGQGWLALSFILAIGGGYYVYDLQGAETIFNAGVLISTGFTIFVASYLALRLTLENLGTIKQVTSLLNDFSLNTYLTRKISSWLYAVSHTAIVLSTAYVVPQALSFGDSIWYFLIGYPVGMAIGVIVAYLVIMLLRLVIEYANAIIHVAENTSK